jgi:hypothetical protein
MTTLTPTDDKMDKDQMDAWNEMMDAMDDHHLLTVVKLAEELKISEACANDIVYLRSRSRHSKILEDKLISLHKAGTPPKMSEFGLDPETGESLVMTEVDYREKRNNQLNAFVH